MRKKQGQVLSVSILKVNSFRHENHDIVSCTDSLAGPGRPCLLSPVNGRHLEYLTQKVLGYLLQ